MIILLTLLQAVAVVLGVTLRALTRDHDPDLAMLGLCFRLAEGVVAFIAPIRTLALLSILASATAAVPPDGAASSLGAFLLKAGGWTGTSRQHASPSAA